MYGNILLGKKGRLSPEGGWKKNFSFCPFAIDGKEETC